jgi:tryptophan synthase beta chain
MNSKFFLPALPGEFPDGDGYFGAFGGKFIPEALVAAVDEVAIEYDRAKADPAFAAGLEQLLSHYAGAIGLFHAFLPDTDVRLIGCEAAGHGVETGKHAATLSAGEPGILHGSRSYVLQDDEGQITEPWSISAGLDYPGVGPEHAYLHDTGRGEYRPVTDAAAMRAFRLLASTEGIIPAIESAHALAGAIEVGTELGPDGLILVNLSGRGDKDMDTATRYFEQDADAARAGGAQK